MSLTNIITLLGGLAMFLYGMRLMGDSLKESSSGALKDVLERLTGTVWKAFLLGLGLTAVIQSSTATIVITSGLVGAEIITLHQSLGIIVGANVGTTVTGQIIRLLDLNTGASSFLNLFKPSTLAPVALIIGIIVLMRGRNHLGKILIGFGILFSGLMNMTAAVESLTETGIIERLFSILGQNPFIGYLVGAGIAFVLQSSSATIGILQAFSMSGQLAFSEIYAVLVGVYLGDCVTTAIVCNIGAKPDAKRVGIVNILFNLCKTILIFAGIFIAYHLGWLNGIWNKTMYSGGIANTNTVFNLACALLMFPMYSVYEKASRKIIRDEKKKGDVLTNHQLEGLNPIFFATPALAFNAAFEVLREMLRLSTLNIIRAFEQVKDYTQERYNLISKDEDMIDLMADRVSNYLVQLSGHISEERHTVIQDEYLTCLTEFERLGDHAVNMLEEAEQSNLSDEAVRELVILQDLIERILDVTMAAFTNCNIEDARHIEPLEEVVDDMVAQLKQNHLERLRRGTCSIVAGTEFLNMLSDIERISDICSNTGTALIARIHPEMKHEIHAYISGLHSGQDPDFNREYEEAHDFYFSALKAGALFEEASE